HHPGAAAQADHALQRRHADPLVVLRRRLRGRRAALRGEAGSRRPRVQPRQPAGYGDQLRAGEHDNPAYAEQVGDHLQAASGSGSRSARALDREGGEAARLQADGVARDGHLEHDSLLPGTHGAADKVNVLNVLVTGASGFIGHNVLLRAPRDWRVTAVYHQAPGLDEFVKQHGLANVCAVRCDLTDAASVAEFAKSNASFDACLYLAANGDPAR